MPPIEKLLERWERLPDAASAFVIVVFTLAFVGLLWRTGTRVIRGLVADGYIAPMMGRRLRYGQRLSLMILTALVLLQVTGLFSHAWALLSTVVAALAVAFVAGWSILSNVTSALLLLTFRPFRVGDRVELVEPTTAQVFSGWVVDMNLMYTVLSATDPETGEPSSLHVPNNLFLQKLVRRHGPVRPSQVTSPPFYPEDGARRSAALEALDQPPAGKGEGERA